MAKKSIPHLEDLSRDRLVHFAEALASGKVKATEKVDGAAFVVFGFDKPNRAWTMPPGLSERIYDPRQYGMSIRYKAIREFHECLKMHVEGRINDWLKENPNPTFGGDVLDSRFPNVIEYGQPGVVVHMAKSNGKLNDDDLMDSFAARMAQLGGPWRFDRVQRVELPVYEGKALKEGKGDDLLAELMGFLGPILQRTRPAQGPKDGLVEGLVFKDADGNLIKLVDRKNFTEVNRRYWKFREMLDRGRKDESGKWIPGAMRRLREELARTVVGQKGMLAPTYVKALATRWVGLSVDEALSGELALHPINEDYVQRAEKAIEETFARFKEIHQEWKEERDSYPEHVRRKTIYTFNEAWHEAAAIRNAFRSLQEGHESLTNRVKAMKLAMGRSALRRLRKALGQQTNGLQEHDPFDNEKFMKDIVESITFLGEDDTGDPFKITGFSKDFDDGQVMKDTPAADVAKAAPELLSKYAQKLAKKGIKPGSAKKLGNGHWGVAFAVGDEVLKITKDVDEAKASNHLKGKNLKHVVHFRDVFRFPPPDDGFYGIIQEKLQPISQGDAKRFDEFVQVLRKVKVGPEMWAGNTDAITAKAKQVLGDDEAKLDAFMEDIEHFDFYGIVKDLAGQKIRFMDYHSGNIMRRGQDFVIIDVGVGQSPGAIPDVLEKVQRRVIQSLTEAKADRVAVTIGRFQPFHKGHATVIRKLAKAFTKVILLVAGNNPSEKNPFSFELREELIRRSLADVETKIEIYKAESGFVPGVLSGLVDNKGSSLDSDMAVEIVVGSDRVEDMKGQLMRAADAKDSGRLDLKFDPGLAKVTKAADVEDAGGKISGTRVRQLLAKGDREGVAKMMDPHITSNEDDFVRLYDEMRDQLGRYVKVSAEEKKEGLEEDIFNIGGEKGIMRIVQAFGDKLKQKGVNVQTIKQLGRGHEGVAFDMGGGKVLKVTADVEEAKACNKLKGKAFKNIGKVFDVFKFPQDFFPNPAYGIIEEMLTPLTDAEINEFQKYMDFIEGDEAFKALRAGDWEALKKNIERMVTADVADDLGLDPKSLEGAPPDKMAKFEEAKGKKVGAVIATFEKFNMPGMLHDLKSAGIQFIDFHGGNVMKRGNDYVINDLGRSKSGGAEPPVLERIMNAVVEYINVPVETDGPGTGVKGGSSPWSAPSRIMTKQDAETGEFPDSPADDAKRVMRQERKIGKTDHRAFETAIARNLRKKGVKAKHLGGSPDQPDIEVQVDGLKAHVEVKMAGAQLGTPRLRFDGTKWKANAESESLLTRKVLEMMRDPEALEFVNQLRKFVGRDKIKVLSTMDKTDPMNVTATEMKRFFAKRQNQYIVKRSDIDLTEFVVGHYSSGKEQYVSYLQLGDGFYTLGSNPLQLKGIPPFKAVGTVGVRVSFRADGRYEVIPEVKASSVANSDFSIAPGSQKRFPFEEAK